MRCVLVHAGIADARMWEPLVPWFQGHEPVGYDLRGFGQMDEADEDWHHVDDLLDLLGEEPAVLVGAGLGARVCLEAALLRPELVLGLVLLAPVADADEPGAVGAAAPRAVRELVAAMQARADAVQQALGVREAPRVGDLGPARLGAVACPALVVLGAEDVPAARAAGAGIARALPGARLADVAGAAALPSLERPAETGALVAGFLAGLS